MRVFFSVLWVYFITWARMLPTLQLVAALIVTPVTAICVKRCVGHRGPSWRRLFVCSGVSAGAAHRGSTTQRPWSRLVVCASRVSARAEARSEPSAPCISPSSFPETGHHEMQLCKTFAQKCESCVARWNLPARGFRRGLFLSAQGTVPAAGVPALLFLCGAASAMRELQHLLDCAYLWGTQNKLVRLATSLSPRMRSQLFCHLRLNLSFPLLVFGVLFRLRARGA